MSTNIFSTLPDIWKVILYTSFQIAGILAGVKIGSVKELIMRFKDVLMDSKLTSEQKVMKLTNIAIGEFAQLNEAWDVLNIEHFGDATEIY